MNRGSIKTKDSRLVAFWIPTDLDFAMRDAVLREDTDLSKFIRSAIRQRLTSVVSNGVESGDPAKN